MSRWCARVLKEHWCHKPNGADVPQWCAHKRVLKAHWSYEHTWEHVEAAVAASSASGMMAATDELTQRVSWGSSFIMLFAPDRDR